MSASDHAAAPKPASTAPSVWNVPNLLTVVRLLMVPLLGWVLLAWPDDRMMRWVATAVLGALTRTARPTWTCPMERIGVWERLRASGSVLPGPVLCC